MNYLSDIDIDITLHLGNIRNIDLLSRGIYSFKISLVYGNLEQKILPIGLFSAPSRLEAYVRDIKVPAPLQFINCTIDSVSNSFMSRTFVIRYKDENHELNEGVHWRLTIPNCDLTDFQRSTTEDYIICSDPLIFRFELLFCELLEHDGNADLTNCIDDFLPPDPILESVAVQELQIQQASTGFHHFFPVKFDRTHFIFLECMLHTAITAIRYKNISMDVLQSPFLSESNTPRTQLINKQIGDNEIVNIDDNDVISSGTWYESDLQISGPIIDEKYYESKISLDQQSQQKDNNNTNNNNNNNSSEITSRAIDRPVRKSFKTPPTTIISPSSRTQQGLLSPYLKLSDKLTDLTSNFPGFSNNSKNYESQQSSIINNLNNNNNNIQQIQQQENTESTIDTNDINIIEDENRIAFSFPPQRIVSSSGLDRSDIEKLVKLYSRPLICNHHLLRDGTQMIIDLFNQWNQQEISKLNKKFQPRTSIDFLCESNFECFLETHEKEIIDSLMIEESISEVYYGISQYLEKSNQEMYGRWSLVLSSLPKIMKEVSERLRGKYVHGMRAFWKGQCLLFSCSESFMKKPNQDFAATNELAILLSQLQKEVRLSSSSSSSNLTLPPTPISSPSSSSQLNNTTNSNISSFNMRSIEIIKGSSKNNQLIPTREILSPTLRPSVKARGLPIFDRSIHLVPSKLPVMLIQQYESNNKNNSSNITNNSESNCNMNSNININSGKTVAINGSILNGDELLYERGGVLRSYSCDIHMNSLSNVWNPSTINVGYSGFDPCLSSFQLLDSSSQPVHLIVLQHGFQGSSFDMRLIRNAIHIEFPNYLFLIATSNENDSGQSLKVMAQNLTQEILNFCREKCPAMIYDSKYKGRVSFIGHSVGGLIIRKCLESPELQVLYNKLHLYISLASPHLGTLYAESQLVSTGMWALLKWKKSAVLQELSLKDSSDYHSTELFSLSQNGVLQYFRHIIFISSPKDLYVPEYSSRVQINSKAILNPYVGYTLTTMAANIISQIDPEKLIRITLDNNVNDSGNVDKVIGRAAHICYLDQMIIVESLVYSLYTIFRLT